jgi:hypothetical protein
MFPQYDKHDDNKMTMLTMTATTATATAATQKTGMAATVATTMKVTWTVMVAVMTTMTTMMPTTTTTTTTMGGRRCDGNKDNGTTRLEQRQSDGDGLASAVPPIRGGNNQLMLTVWTEKGRGEGDWMEITSSPLNHFQIDFPNTPELQTHGILFPMCHGSKAVLSAPW